MPLPPSTPPANLPANPPSSNPELDAEALFLQLAAQVVTAMEHADHVAIVGIHSGGAWLAERLADAMGLRGRLGFIDISFYRDDYAQRGLHPVVKSTHIPFDVNHATILLVDDVLYTGRTARAAMNELFDYGRPAKIILAALIDRGGRELPISADFVAQTLTLTPQQSLVLHRADDGKLVLHIDTKTEAPTDPKIAAKIASKINLH